MTKHWICLAVGSTCSSSSCIRSYWSWTIKISCISCWKGLDSFVMFHRFKLDLFYSILTLIVFSLGWVCSMDSCQPEKPAWGSHRVPISQTSTWGFLCICCATVAAKILFYIFLAKVNILPLFKIFSCIFTAFILQQSCYFRSSIPDNIVYCFMSSLNLG